MHALVACEGLDQSVYWAYVFEQKRAESGLSGRPMRLQDSLAHLDAMASALAAACAFSDAECGFAAAEAVKTAVRLGQQVQSPPR